MAKRNKPLDIGDLTTLEATPGTTWVPKDPRETILPYVEEVTKETADIESRRAKAKEVYDGYSNVIEECKRLEDEISEKAKDVSVPLNRQQHLRVIEAIGRVFSGQQNKITFEMYKTVVQALAKISTNSPGPGDV